MWDATALKVPNGEMCRRSKPKFTDIESQCLENTVIQRREGFISMSRQDVRQGILLDRVYLAERWQLEVSLDTGSYALVHSRLTPGLL
jgi:hypothetical protein